LDVITLPPNGEPVDGADIASQVLTIARRRLDEDGATDFMLAIHPDGIGVALISTGGVDGETIDIVAGEATEKVGRDLETALASIQATLN